MNHQLYKENHYKRLRKVYKKNLKRLRKNMKTSKQIINKIWKDYKKQMKDQVNSIHRMNMIRMN